MSNIDEAFYYGGLLAALLYIVIYFLGPWTIPIIAFNFGATLFAMEKIFALWSELMFMFNATWQDCKPPIVAAMAAQFERPATLQSYGFTAAVLLLLWFAYVQSQFMVALVLALVLILHYEHRRRMLIMLNEVWENIREPD